MSRSSIARNGRLIFQKVLLARPQPTTRLALLYSAHQNQLLDSAPLREEGILQLLAVRGRLDKITRHQQLAHLGNQPLAPELVPLDQEEACLVKTSQQPRLEVHQVRNKFIVCDLQLILDLANPNAGPYDGVAPVSTGSSNPAYSVFSEKDSTNSSVTLQYQSITCMPSYRGNSFEVSLTLSQAAVGRNPLHCMVYNRH